MKQYIACKAFIIKDDAVLVIREAPEYKGGTQTGRYNFPGGKVEPGEHIEDALKRETEEESGLSIDIKRPFYVNEWRPTINGETVQIIGIYYECIATGDTEVALNYEHDDFQWIPLGKPNSIDLIDTNLQAWKEYLALKHKDR